MKKSVLLSDDTRADSTVWHENKHYVVLNQLDSRIEINGYQVCLNDGLRYPTIAKLGNKRLAIRLCNFLEKHTNCKAVLYGNRYYIKNIIKRLVIAWLLAHKCYKSYVGHTPLSQLVKGE